MLQVDFNFKDDWNIFWNVFSKKTNAETPTHKFQYVFHLHSPLVVLMSLKCPLKDTTQSQSTSRHEDDKLDQAIISFCFCFYQNRQTGRKIDDESSWKSPIYHRQDTFPLLTFFYIYLLFLPCSWAPFVFQLAGNHLKNGLFPSLWQALQISSSA